MRIGDQRRNGRANLDALHRNEKYRKAQLAKTLRDELRDAIREAEELLAFLGKPVEEERRDELTKRADLLLKLMNEELEQALLQLENAQWELEDLRSHCAKLEEINQLQSQLIGLYVEKSSRQEENQQELQQQIEELQKQLEEMMRKPARSPGNGEKTPEEQKADLQKKIQAAEKRKKALEQKLEKLEALVTDPPEPENKSEEVITSDTEAETGEKDNDAEAETKDPTSEQDDHDESAEQEEAEGDALPDDAGAEEGGDGTSKDDPEAMAEKIRELEEELRIKNEQLEEVKYQAQRDSHTSSVPPSMNGYRGSKPGRPQVGSEEDIPEEDIPEEDSQEGECGLDDDETAAEETARRDPDKSPNRRRGGKRGKPKGGKGAGRQMPEYDEEYIVYCEPSRCSGCPHREYCQARAEAKPVDRPRSVYDIEIRRVKTDYQPVKCNCPLEGVGTIAGTYPEALTNWFQFGNGIRALAVMLNTVGMVSYDRIADILQGLIGDSHLSAVTINRWVRIAANNLGPLARYLKAGVFDGDYLNNDETGVKVKGVLYWLHTAVNLSFTYMRVDRQRGEKAIERIGVLPAYEGTIITDCWASYWEYGTAHGLCNAHLLRELYALVKFFEKDREWAQKMMDLFDHMKKRRDTLKENGETAFDPEELEELRRRYREIIEEGLKVHPDTPKTKGRRGKEKKSRGRNLLERLKEREENFLLFLTDFNVPYTNNDAERSLRLVCIKKRVVGSFDTYEGADDFALIWSYISTARKRGLNPYEAIKSAMAKDAVDFLFDEEERAHLEEVAQNLDKKGLEYFEQCKLEEMEAVNAARVILSKKEKNAATAREKEAKAKAKMEEANAALEKAEAALNGAPADSPNYRQLMEAVEKARQKADKAATKAQKAQADREKKEQLAESARQRAYSRALEANLVVRATGYFLSISEEDLPVYSIDDIA